MNLKSYKLLLFLSTVVELINVHDANMLKARLTALCFANVQDYAKMCKNIPNRSIGFEVLFDYNHVRCVCFFFSYLILF